MRSSRHFIPRPDPADAAFLTDAIGTGMLVMEICELAMQRDAPDALRRQGEELISQHTRMDESLRALARQKGAPAPVALAADDQMVVTELNEVPSQDLAERCLLRLIECTERLIAACEEARDRSRDGDVRALAVRHLRRLQPRLEEITRLSELYSPRRAGTT